MKTTLLSFALLATLAACTGATTTVDLGDPNAPTSNSPSTSGTSPSGSAEAPAATPKAVVETLLSGQHVPDAITVSGNYVFYRAGGDVQRYDLGEKRLVSLGLHGIEMPMFASDANGFFVGDRLTKDGIVPTIIGSKVPGCSLQECDGFIAEWTTEVGGPLVAFGIDATHVYWISSGAGWSYALHRATRQETQGAPVTSEIVAEWSDISPTQMVVDDDAIWIGATHELLRFDKGTKQLRLALDVGPGRIAADATHLWWLASREQELHLTSFEKASGKVERTKLEQSAYKASGLVAAAGTNAIYVAWQSSGLAADGRLVRFDKTTKVRTDIANDLAGAMDFTVSGGYVYWTNPRSGTVQRLRDL